MQRRAGFTLIELMIVIAIIAIIAAIAIPNLIEARKSGNESAAIGGLRTMAAAQSLFRNEDRDGDGVFDYGTLVELGQTSLIDATLASGAKYGYTFAPEFPGADYAVNAFPATAKTGSRNFRMTCGSDPPEDCEIRQSASGIPTETSPLVPASEGNPADSIPPTSSGASCGMIPTQVVPTTPELQAAADMEVRGFLASSAAGLVMVFEVPADDLTRRLFELAPGASVAPDQAVLGSLDSDGNGALGFDEIAAPFGQFSAENAIAGVQNAYGSCQATCLAAGETSASCETSCSTPVPSPGPTVGDVEGALVALVATLPSVLDLGMGCEETTPALPLSGLTGDPLAFLYDTFGLGSKVPLLAPPLVAALALVLFVSGLRRARRSRAERVPSARP